MTSRRLAQSLMVSAFLVASGSAFAQCDTRFTLRNVSGVQVDEFYFGSSRNPNWGQDRLGDNVLPNGGTQSFRTAQSGLQDFKISWENGETAELKQIDICATNEIVATRKGIEAR
jgi:hypothetical protein